MNAREAGRALRALLAEHGDGFASRMPDQLQEYWTTGRGAAQIRWCTPGAFERARRALRKYVPEPGMLDGLVANLYHRVCGHWPGERKD